MLHIISSYCVFNAICGCQFEIKYMKIVVCLYSPH